jgi:hypothetical protein
MCIEMMQAPLVRSLAKRKRMFGAMELVLAILPMERATAMVIMGMVICPCPEVITVETVDPQQLVEGMEQEVQQEVLAVVPVAVPVAVPVVGVEHEFTPII